MSAVSTSPVGVLVRRGTRRLVCWRGVNAGPVGVKFWRLGEMNHLPKRSFNILIYRAFT